MNDGIKKKIIYKQRAVLGEKKMTNQKSNIKTLFTGSVCRKFGEELLEEMGIGVYGLGAMPWPTIELQDGKIYIDEEEQGAKE